jgi:protein-tyrosine phosphatase
MTKLPIPESYWVEENRLLAGEYPASRDPETARHRIEAFLKAGIRTFIDLTQPHELVPYEPILQEQTRIYDLDLAYHHFPIRDHGVPSSQSMSEILDAVDDSIENGKPVYIHCWGGVGRTGIAVACHFIRRGLSAEDALVRVGNLYKTRPQSHFFATSPETPEQFEFVRNWWEEKPRSRRPRYCEG